MGASKVLLNMEIEQRQEEIKQHTITFLKEEMEAKGISQLQLQEASGVPQKTISRILNGHNMPSFPTLLALCEALDADVSLTFTKENA